MEIERKRGDTYADKFTVNLKETWEPANLAGCTFLLTLDSRENPTDASTQVYQLVGSVPDPITGAVFFAPTSSQANLVGFYYFDVEMTDGTGKVRTIAKGKYVYKQDITK